MEVKQMKLKNIGILVLAAAVLAVMTSGMASAASYSGTLKTTYYDASPVRNSKSSGTVSVSVGSYIDWTNNMNNQDSHQVTGYVRSDVWTTSSPKSRVLDLNPGDSGAYSISASGGTTNNFNFGGNVREDGNCNIAAWHDYVDNGVTYGSLLDWDMYYT
jgi:Flp pilus assembly protein TadG